jgi:hypothetical protein
MPGRETAIVRSGGPTSGGSRSRGAASVALLLASVLIGAACGGDPDSVAGTDERLVSSDAGWTRTIGRLPPLPRYALAPRIAPRAGGGVFVGANVVDQATAMATPDFEAPPTQIVLQGLAADGGVDWTLSAEGAEGTYLFDVTSDGEELFAVGSLAGTLSFGGQVEVSSDGPALFLVRVGGDGSVRSAVSLATGAGAVGSDLKIAASGSAIFFAGSFVGELELGTQRLAPIESSRDIVIGRLSPAGDVAWVLGAGTAAEDFSTQLSVPDGSDAVTVAFRSDPAAASPNGPPSVTVLSIDAAGRIAWTLAIEGSSEIEPAAILGPQGDGETLVALNVEGAFTVDSATLEPELTNPRRRAVVLAIDEHGGVRTHRSLPGSVFSEIHALSFTPSGAIGVAGVFVGRLDVGGSPTPEPLDGDRWTDGTAAPTGFVVELSSIDGDVRAYSFPRLNSRVPLALIIADTDSAHLAGEFQTPLDVGAGEIEAPAGPTAFVAGTGWTDLFERPR